MGCFKANWILSEGAEKCSMSCVYLNRNPGLIRTNIRAWKEMKDFQTHQICWRDF